MGWKRREKALRNILKVVVPMQLRIGWEEIKTFWNGYSQEKVIQRIVEEARANKALTDIKLKMIYLELEAIYGNE